MNDSIVPSDATPLSAAQIQDLKNQVPEWGIVVEDGEKRLRRVFEFRDFADAQLFANKLTEQAEKEGHHPRLVVEYGQVTVDWWTHSAHGLNADDFSMAVRTDDTYSRWELISGEKDAIEQASEESFPASDPPGW